MATWNFYVERAVDVLVHVRLAHFIGLDGTPTDECITRMEEGRLSSGERVLVALALAIVDRGPIGDSPPKVSDLMRLDNDNLRAVGKALIALADHR